MGSTIAKGSQVNARAEAVGPRKSPGTLKTPPPIRPGISPNYLTQAGVRCVDAMEAKRLCGMEEPSLWIPYRQLDGSELLVDRLPFGRLRLDSPLGNQKYHQRKNSGAHAYLPPRMNHFEPKCDMVLCEGEFKALSLAEEGFCAV